MQSIEFQTYINEDTIKIPTVYPDWYGSGPIKVILLRQQSHEEIQTTPSHTRPIGLAKDKFQVPPQFFEELPEDLLEAFEGKSL
jgi:hypothetical protein